MFKDFVGQRATSPQRQCEFYLDSKLVRGLGNDGITIGVSLVPPMIAWVATEGI